MKKFFVLVSICCLGLCSCRGSDKELAQETVSVFLEGYKQKDESISELFVGSDEADIMSFEGVSACFAEKMEYEINSCKSVGNEVYNVEAVIKTIDFGKLFEEAYAEVTGQYGEEGIAGNFILSMETKIDNEEYDIYEMECQILVRKVDDRFKIQLDSGLANGLTGGMNEYLNSLVGGE